MSDTSLTKAAGRILRRDGFYDPDFIMKGFTAPLHHRRLFIEEQSRPRSLVGCTLGRQAARQWKCLSSRMVIRVFDCHFHVAGTSRE